MALSDGAHTLETPLLYAFSLMYPNARKEENVLTQAGASSVEDFSYFTLRHEATPDRPATSLFGISCTRQMDANELINRPADVTRSTVQKAVVVITDSPHHFGQLREKLLVVTTAWFAQRYVFG